MATVHSPQFLKIVQSAKTRVQETTVHEVNKKISEGILNFILLDVREESEWQAGRIPHAIHLSKGIIERDIEEKIPDKDKELILYCGGGFRSALAADNLQKMGYTKVISMDGGYRAWKEMGLSIIP